METSKNILIVAHHYPPHISGVGMVAYNHARRLAAEGYKVTVVTSDTSPKEKSYFADGVNVVRIKAWNISESWSAPFPIFSPRLLSALVRYVKAADVVHVHDAFYISSFWATIFAWVYKKPVVLTQHVAMIAHPSKIVVAIQKIVYATTGALIFKISRTVITFNDRIEKFLIDKGVPKEKLIVLFNGVDMDIFHSVDLQSKKDARKKFGLSVDKKILLFVGRFVPKKGFDKVLAVRSEDYQIVCVGGEKPEGDYGDEVVFLGKLDQKKLAEIYQASDIFILPSESEGFPLSIQEAMASGIPIVTTNDEGYSGYNFDTNNIYLINDTSKTSIVAAIKTLFADETRLSVMAKYSEEYAKENFNLTRSINQLEDIYDNVLNKKNTKLLNRQKIAIVSDAVYPFNKGGKEKRLYDITTRLAEKGYDVTIYCMQWWKGGKTFINGGVKFYAISPYYSLYHNESRSIKQAILFAFNCLKLLWHEFDVIEVDHIPPLVLFTTKIVCILKRKKMIVTWHEVWGKKYWKNYLGTFGGFIGYQIEKVSTFLPNSIVSVSDHTTHDLIHILRTKKPIMTIANGLDFEIIKDSIASNKVSDIIFAGRLLSHKNVNILLRAVAIIKKTNPNILLFVIGEGPEKGNLERLAIELNITGNVSFLGFIESHQELCSMMRASKVFVLPSTREGFGITVIESNACGLPVVTINDKHNAAKELIIQNENGIVCQLEPEALAEAIQKMLSIKKEPSFYMRYSERYSWNQIFPKIEEVYKIKE